MGAGRSVVWSPGIVLGLLLHATAAVAQTDAARPGDAMAFIRVRGRRARRLRRGPGAVERKGAGAGDGERLRRRSLGARPDEPARGRRGRGEGPVPRGRGGGLGREPAHRGRDRRAAARRGCSRRTWSASDAESDLAALQVTAADLPYLPLGDSDAVEPGRPVKVLGFPFGRQVEVGKRADAGVVPEVTVTAGSFSAARANEEGETRFLQTDATVNPGNSGGPMLDEDGYVVGRREDEAGPRRGEPGGRLLGAGERGQGLPRGERSPGASCRWRGCGRACATPSTGSGVAIELPDGYSDQSTSRILADGGRGGRDRLPRLSAGDRLAVAALEEAILGGREVPGFVPAPAAAGRRQHVRAGERPSRSSRGSPPSVIGSAAGTDASGRAFRVEYAIVDREDEKVVARYLGPADAVAFNLGLIRRSLGSLEAAPMLVKLSPSAPGGRGVARARAVVVSGGRGASPGSGGLVARAGHAVGLPAAAPAGKRPGGEPSPGLHAGAAGAAVDGRRPRAGRGRPGLRRGDGSRGGAPGRGGAAVRRCASRASACRSRSAVSSSAGRGRACCWSSRPPWRSCRSSRASTSAGSARSSARGRRRCPVRSPATLLSPNLTMVIPPMVRNWPWRQMPISKFKAT